MRIGRLVIVPFVLLSVGCFQGQRTFKVNADGSGTIVDTTKLGEQAKGMLQGMEEMDKSSPAEKKAKKKAKLAEKAAAMGEGVSFVSVEPTKDGGEVTTYAFKDITKLKASGMPTPDESTTSKDEPLTFKLAKNAAGNSVLTVVSPKEKPADPAAKTEAKPKPKPEEIQQQIAMMKGMMAGLKIKSVVEVNGKLVKTSSPYAVGPVVTLMEMDFDALDAAALQKLSEAGPGGPPTPAMMKGIKGIKVSDPEVTIEFTGGK
jgi:hypothetical protein